MSNYKKIVLIFLLAIFFLFILVNFSSAAERKLEVKIPGLETDTLPALPDYIVAIYNFALMIIGLICFGAIIYGGIRYLTSAGKPAAMADAKDQIFAALLGLIILFSAYLILTTINPELIIFVDSGTGPTAGACNDTDGGEDKLTQGTCTDTYGSYTDSCLDSFSIAEYTCNLSGTSCVGLTDASCPSSHPNCVNGACVAGTPGACSDTDGGVDKLTKGTCTDANGSYTDICYSTTEIIEYFCKGDWCEYTSGDIFCPHQASRCLNGVCVP